MAPRRTEQAEQPPARPTAKKTASTTGARHTRAAQKTAQPAAAARGAAAWADARESFPKRVTVPLTEEDYRRLKHAQADDDIDTAARIRAMIYLWETNARYRARIERIARTAMSRRR